MARFYIQKCKYRVTKPCITALKTYSSSELNLFKLSENPKAPGLISLCSLLNKLNNLVLNGSCFAQI